MGNSKYLIRLDDASHYSDLSKWKLLDKLFDKYEVKPIIAAIPDNQDTSIQYDSYNQFYWEWLHSMDKRGWSIALHGYQHLYHKIDRKKNLLPFYNKSEFSGLALEEQKEKIKKAIAIFKKHNIFPKVWVAPGHCFDLNTINAILQESDINIISDGIAFNPYFKFNIYFVPQQLWGYKKRHFGLWTICLHPDTMSLNEIKLFEETVKFLYKEKKLTTIDKIRFIKKGPTFFDQLYSFFFWTKYNLKRLIKLW
jgi:predicted deacetylase